MRRSARDPEPDPSTRQRPGPGRLCERPRSAPRPHSTRHLQDRRRSRGFRSPDIDVRRLGQRNRRDRGFRARHRRARRSVGWVGLTVAVLSWGASCFASSAKRFTPAKLIRAEATDSKIPGRLGQDGRGRGNLTNRHSEHWLRELPVSVAARTHRPDRKLGRSARQLRRVEVGSTKSGCPSTAPAASSPSGATQFPERRRRSRRTLVSLRTTGWNVSGSSTRSRRRNADTVAGCGPRCGAEP